MRKCVHLFILLLLKNEAFYMSGFSQIPRNVLTEDSHVSSSFCQ